MSSDEKTKADSVKKEVDKLKKEEGSIDAQLKESQSNLRSLTEDSSYSKYPKCSPRSVASFTI